MNKIIFLDFDGVLNSASWFKTIHESREGKPYVSSFERSTEQLDPRCVKMISDLAVSTGSNIIVSSSWRILHELHEIQDILEARGMVKEVLPIGVTPDSHKRFRGDEVKMWLAQNPRVHTHVIFDDDGDFYSDQPLVKTSWEDGLLPHHVELAREILLNRK